MMKKKVAMVLSLVCAVSLLAAGCGNSEKKETAAKEKKVKQRQLKL